MVYVYWENNMSGGSGGSCCCRKDIKKILPESSVFTQLDHLCYIMKLIISTSISNGEDHHHKNREERMCTSSRSWEEMEFHFSLP